jgi:multidrug transporter EmrE-like cation transporter
MASSTSQTARATVGGPERVWRVVVAIAIVGGPLGYLVGSALHPPAQQIGEGALTIGANVDADPFMNGVHLVAYAAASFLLPIGAAGLGYLAYHQTPWLATIGGLLGVVGWLPFAALTALDALAVTMVHSPQAASYAALYSRFETGPVMSMFLLVYVVGHLVAYVLLGIALLKSRVIPGWAAWSMIGSSGVTMAAFVLPGRPVATVGVAGLALLLIGCLPAARPMLTSR